MLLVSFRKSKAGNLWSTRKDPQLTFDSSCMLAISPIPHTDIGTSAAQNTGSIKLVLYYCWWFRNPANQLRLVLYPIIYRGLHFPGGAGFLPPTVVKLVWPLVVANTSALRAVFGADIPMESWHDLDRWGCVSFTTFQLLPPKKTRLFQVRPGKKWVFHPKQTGGISRYISWSHMSKKKNLVV